MFLIPIFLRLIRLTLSLSLSRVVTWAYSRIFDIPFNSLVPYVSERLFLETDFENEANNAERMAKLVEGEPRLRDRIHIPKVYREYSSKRVMTAEWIEGVRLWDKDSITRPWEGGWYRGSPGCHGTPLDRKQVSKPKPGSLKPERDYWRGKNGKGGLGLSLQSVMSTMVDLFSAQMFLWGYVHCDPHPGNIFIRRQPSGNPELVLIDHGLYIHMSPEFRRQYAEFWKALLTFDNTTLRNIVSDWGVNNVELFASATLMRPYRGGGGGGGGDKGLINMKNLSQTERANRNYELQTKARQAVRDILGDETRWPKELVFIGRNLRIVQANNQYMGSPVNRLKITGLWASRALLQQSPPSSPSPSPKLPTNNSKFGIMISKIHRLAQHFFFWITLFGSDLFFYFTRLRQFFRLGGGMEDEIEAQMQQMAREVGVELKSNVFEG